ncbi:hypothetical protein HO133_008092 [Letharia lupina]|uniref:Uncharacterized protein n=1 Tax=Letharia lupina TaxID=560253 RepID=A0A8H6CRR9_9LECA|nr:uncharacterized protein HO133_008092 [Letharia lupina]KAF6228362.1 hypothetical protein HO133_008092 [Letharia lupina]
MPMPWIWSCHKCHTRYHLGATRRCLHDGHYFCGGTTVDKISGKVKKHRACVSEFDYSGWEDFARWKRATSRKGEKAGRKHCEDECDFPSSCHWKEQHPVQETGFGFLDPSCLDTEPDTSSVEGKLTVQESTGSYIGKIRRAAEKRTTKVAKALLSPIAEEDQKASSSLDPRPRMNGLGLHFPVMDFSSSKNSVKEIHGHVDKAKIKLSIPNSRQMSGRVVHVWEDDVDMTDWITPEATESPPISPCARPDAVEVPFDFGLEQDQGPPASVADDDSPVSPMRSAWNWTAGGIGVALSPPALPIEDEIWDEGMEDEMDEADMMWDRGETVKAESLILDALFDPVKG